MKKVTSAIAAAALATSLLGCSSTLTTQQTAQVAGASVSYTHLTLPTSDLV